MGIYLGIDCGATNLRAGLLDDSGNLTQKWQVPSPLKTNPQSFAQIVKGAIGEADFDAIGIGVPGPLDLEKGLILPSSNIGNKEPLEIVTLFESLFNKKVALDRDTVVALIGEAWKGAAKDCQNVVMLTLGTGVGGAIMVNGEIDRGEGGKAGEIGHMIVDSSSKETCGLGHQGCLEALINSVNDLDGIGQYLGLGLANIVDIFNPEKIIIGGGKLAKGDFLTKALDIMGQNSIQSAASEVSVEYAKLKEWSGVYGSAKLAMDKNDNK